jgi:hypothetical protein
MAPEDNIVSKKQFFKPQLMADSSNWIMWKQQTLSALMMTKGFNGTWRGCLDNHLPFQNFQMSTL